MHRPSSCDQSSLSPRPASPAGSVTTYTHHHVRPDSASHPFLAIEPSSVELFSGLAKDERDAVLAAGTVRRFKAHEIVVRADEVANQLFLIKTGVVDFYIITTDGREVLLGRLVPGDVFGVAAFLSKPLGYLGTAQSVHESEILTWPRQLVNQLARVRPGLAENALRTALRYLALYVKRHIGLVSNSASERLASTLTSLGSRAGHILPSGIEIDIKNEDLASLADVGFFTASRILKEWERKGALEKTRGKVLLRCPEKLLT